MEAKKINNGGSDRISSLPEVLIHQIFSFMDTRDVVHTSLLSTRWRYLWLTTPVLDFDLDYWLDVSESSSREKFMDFVEKVFVTRGNSDIYKFRLYTYSYEFDFDLPRVSKWLIRVLACNVQHLVLRFPLGTWQFKYDWKGFKLPHNLFAKSVKTLEISFCPDPLVLLPDICGTSLIRNLQLHGVKLPERNENGELVLRWNVLEDLMIHYCDANHLETITISTPLLERMQIRLYIDRKIDHNGRKVAHKVKVKTYAKNLKTLVFLGYSDRKNSPVYLSIKDDLFSLNSACIRIGAKMRVVWMKECYQCFMKILPRVCHALDLVVDICTKQILTGVPLLLEELSCRFHNLRYIKLSDEIAAPSLGAILNFLEIFPRIETLVWKRAENQSHRFSSYGSSDEEENIVNVAEEVSASNLSFQTMFTCLKTLKIVNFQGAEIELEFLTFVLERAILLKEVIIKCERSLSDERVAVLKEKLLAMHQVCPNVLLTLLEKPPIGLW